MSTNKTDVVAYLYNKLCNTTSDIHEHLPALMKLASHCESVAEVGVRNAVSTWAFIEGLRKNNQSTKTLISIDINDVPDIDFVAHHAMENGIDFTFMKHDSITADIPEVDLLFLDSWHCYAHLKGELESQHSKAKKFIVMHDTESYKLESESFVFKADLEQLSKDTGHSVEDISKGIGPAIIEFLGKHPEWIVGIHFENNNGLTILERKDLKEKMNS